MSLLSVVGVGKTFGGLHAVQGVSLELRAGGIFGLIGPNGAGKTTLFNLITGVYRPDAGQISFAGRDITGLSPAKIADLGIARTFQNIRLFRAMNVEQNVMVAGHHLHRASLLSAMFRTRRHAEDERALRSRALELLDLFGLRECAHDVAGSLPYGSQRRLEIARALMLEPKLLLLDEPAAGMNSQEAEGLKRQVRFLRDELNVSVLLVEHNMSVVMGVCDVVHVLDQGRSIAEGDPLSVQSNPRVVAAYLGRETEPPPGSHSPASGATSRSSDRLAPSSGAKE